jgi:hypothetical protein
LVIKGFAISGKAGAGKTTFAKAVSWELWHLGARRSVRAPLGDALKVILWERRGMTKDDPGGREELMALGDELRAENPNVFCEKLDEMFEADQRIALAGWIPIVDDVRRRNELEWARAKGFYLVRIEAGLEQRAAWLRDRGSDPLVAWSNHLTEVDLDDCPDLFDHIVYNGPGECIHCRARSCVMTAAASAAAQEATKSGERSQT